MNRSSQIVSLIIKFRNRQLTEEEKCELLEWAAIEPAYQKILDDFSLEQSAEPLHDLLNEYINQEDSLDFEKVIQAILSESKPKLATFYRKVWIAAACVVVCLGFTLMWWKSGEAIKVEDTIAVEKSIKPGEKSAVLQTENGQEYILSSYDSLTILNDGQLEIQNKGEKSILPAGVMTLIVPTGNEFSVSLADGTEVWLNSSSKLQFPTKFNGDSRLVNLEGEAYFDVSTDRDKPFIVEHERQRIKVLGTRFNVSGYTEDEVVITALYEGEIEVEDKVLKKKINLMPGEMVRLDPKLQEFKKEKKDLSTFNAWTNGLFSFDEAPFQEVMKEVARWYNVEVIYQSSIPTDMFSGDVSRDVPFTVMLDFLRGSGIQIVQKNNQLIIN